MKQASTALTGLFFLAKVCFFLIPGAVGLLRRGTGWPLVAVLGAALGVTAAARLSLPLVLTLWAVLLLAAVLLRRRPRSK